KQIDSGEKVTVQACKFKENTECCYPSAAFPPKLNGNMQPWRLWESEAIKLTGDEKNIPGRLSRPDQGMQSREETNSPTSSKVMGITAELPDGAMTGPISRQRSRVTNPMTSDYMTWQEMWQNGSSTSIVL